MTGPITLNRQQFLATAAGKKPGAKYSNYLAYIAKARGNTQAPPPQDPYSSIIAGLPSPLTPQQIQTQAAGEISPLVAAATKQIQGQTQAATNAIRGYSQDAASKLGAINFAQPYQQAETGQAAVDAALRASLTGAGTAGADALSQRLAVINDPSVAAAVQAVGANGAANGNTQLAQGSAALGNLLANAAAAGNYGQKLPGISNLAGLQQITGTQQQGLNQISSQTQALEQQLPSIIQALTSQNDNRTQTLTAARENQVARQDAIAATNAKNQTTVQTAQIKAQAQATQQEIAQGRSDRTYRLQFAKTFGYDPVSGRTLPGYTINAKGEVVKAAAARKAKQPQLTAAQRQKYMGLAATIASNGQSGFTDSKGGVHPAITWQQALVEMDKEGVPQPLALAAIQKFYPVNIGTPASSFPPLSKTAGKK